MNALDPMADLITVRRYLDPIRRRLPLVLVGCLLGAALGYGASTRVTTSYTSKVAMLISPISSDPIDGVGTGAVEVDLETEAEVATSVVVADRVNEILGNEPPAKAAEDLLDQVDTVIKGTRVMELHFTARTPEVAQRGALAFSEAYLAYRADLANEQLAISSQRLETRIGELQIELTDVSSRKADLPESEQDSAVYAALEINEQTLLDELSLNQGRLADIRAVLTDDATIIDPPTLPRNPSSLGLPTLLLGGVATGLVATLGLVFALEAARRGREANHQAVSTSESEPVVAGPDDVLEARVPAIADREPAVEPEPASSVVAPIVASTMPAEPNPGTPLAEPEREATASFEDSGAPSADNWLTELEIDEWDTAAAALADASAEPPADSWMATEPTPTYPWAATEPVPTNDDPWAATEPAPTNDYPWATTADTPADDPWATAEPTPDDDPWAATEPAPTNDYPWATTAGTPTDDPWAAPEPTPTDDPGAAPEPTPTDDPWAMVDAPADYAWTAPEPTPTNEPWAATEPTPTSDPAPIALVPATSISLAALLNDRARESVAQLRDHLAHAVDVDRRSIVVVDGGDGAATPVAVAVAMELAAAGRTVLLIDTDDAGRGLGARLGLADAPGLAEAIRRGGDLEGLPLGVVGQAGLRLLCQGNQLAATLAEPGAMTAIDRIVADNSTVVFACGLASTAMPLVAGGSWIGATTIATTAMADPRAIPVDEYRVVRESRHPLIGIVSIMPRAALSPNRN